MTNEIICPHCGESFQLDKAGYAHILSQVRDREFNRELNLREKQLDEKAAGQAKLMRMELEQAHREARLADEQTIADLRRQLETSGMQQELAVTKANRAKEQEIAELKAQLDSQRIRFDTEKKGLEEQVAFYRDFKARQSTKMVGESLEQHCLNQFNAIRMTAFPRAEFGKDNDAATGSKGDFIFRESEDGTQFISIMFEMKNEMDTTATKHRNEDFLKELDKDRREKGCEYAVLVSMLEADNDLYNNGIVDVSYRYPKMYVVRPQFFIPIITLLRNAARNSLDYQRELQVVKNQQLDFVHFEENLATFKDGFLASYTHANERFTDAVDGIDKAIKQLQKIKDNLTKADSHLHAAQNKLEDVTIRKLTKNAPSVRALLDQSRP